MSRDEVLSKLGPRGWLIDHAQKYGLMCGCTADTPAKTCDLGEALHRLRMAELAKAPSRRRR